MKMSILKALVVLAALIFIAWTFTLVIRDLGAMRVKAHFDYLRPFRGSAQVFYKGYKVGRSTKIRPADDYSHTVMDIVLYPRDLKLPKNIEVQLRKKTILYKFQHDYIEIILPKEPDTKMLAQGDEIKGTTTIDARDYLASQDPRALENIRNNLENATADLGNMLNAMADLFTTLDDTVKQSQKNLVKVSENMQTVSKNTAEISIKLNNSIKQEGAKATFESIQNTAKHIEEMSENLNSLSKDLSNQSDEINSAIKNTNKLLVNANSLTGGINATLKKRFGTMRLLFGRPISE